MTNRASHDSTQVKPYDPEVAALCRHLRSAIDMLEKIVSARTEALPCAPPRSIPTPAVQPAREPAPARLTYTLKEAAAVIGVGRSTLYNAIAQQDLRVVKLGRRTLIPAEALQGWIASLPSRREGLN